MYLSHNNIKNRIAEKISFSVGILVLLLFSSPIVGEEKTVLVPPTKQQLAFFEQQVRPLLIKHCYQCHSEKSEEVDGGLRLDYREGLISGGESGTAVVPGQASKSLLIKAVQYTDPLMQMPPEEKLKQREIDILKKWVNMGLPDPRISSSSKTKPAHGEHFEAAKNWWSFQTVKTVAIPNVRQKHLLKTPIDHFILAKLEQEKISPAPQASKRVLIRRVTYDLTGLPPTPAEIDAFLQDETADAFSKLVERLLSTQQYGERWGRHWLDVVRYADTAGCNSDYPMPEAYRYRNYVINSFNKDKPFDQFLREQLAGDLLPYENEEQKHEQIIATGYLAISRRFSSLNEEFHLTIDDTIDNLGQAMLGLTLSCTRCHEHKFDPIPHEDYYALYGIFQSTKYAFPGTEIYRHMQFLTPLASQQEMEKITPILKQMEELDPKILDYRTRADKMDTGKEKKALMDQWRNGVKQRIELIKKLPKHKRAYGASEGIPTNERLHIKGEPDKFGEVVQRGFLQILGGQKIRKAEQGSGRKQLAFWITDEQNPLTARVFVNRVWRHHFGNGLVRSPNDFGTRGEHPTHPELLDWLTKNFIEGGWSVKSLHRMILLSSTWQSACVENETLASIDPTNKLLWTFNRRKLEAEELRDAMLMVSGRLDRSMGGEHPFPAEWKWKYSQHRPFVGDFPTNKRTVYLMQQRIRPQPFLGIFDGADTNASTGKRLVSTSPQQALFLMNDKFIHSLVYYYVDRLRREEKMQTARIQKTYRELFGRKPTEREIEIAINYLNKIKSEVSPEIKNEKWKQDREAWASYLRVLWSSNEFAFID